MNERIHLHRVEFSWEINHDFIQDLGISIDDFFRIVDPDPEWHDSHNRNLLKIMGIPEHRQFVFLEMRNTWLVLVSYLLDDYEYTLYNLQARLD